ncbi:MAG: hypothetical protein AVDCRST_MAG87-3707 [uncultured Thermomicrobiales bacterium]|uniref:Uncharacterized protein n=1 Tax=uncultured Thermomicrobiales bacterium TaxID=1645740 RepID=A0A6J4VPI7_9BACT|nr:MAG: hypothetical protein AVDCRST_MAG87-3707 [uncultured Thermomicrobiales bacterium]
MGRYLIVLLKERVVIGRVRPRSPEFDHETHGFMDMLDLACALAEA